jgi:hypothetical protein
VIYIFKGTGGKKYIAELFKKPTEMGKGMFK